MVANVFMIRAFYGPWSRHASLLELCDCIAGARAAEVADRHDGGIFGNLVSAPNIFA